MDHKGVEGSMFNWIKDFLLDRIVQMSVGNKIAKYITSLILVIYY